ncbi:STAS domain-containing protein [Desertivirga xinjiangensis]|uniref:STAS domain-containing protein n=1 Tax=Desertivirga xinjiangensis TaxID=539206 RepID=UPI00210929C1|nr:STAS domain-containing protein [Pedobacter xinjiangensis]
MIETFTHSNYTVAKLQIKEANLDVAEQFKTEILQLIDKGQNLIIVSFENVAYVDSSFLGALVSVLKYAMSKNGDIAVVQLNKDINNLFNLIRMNKVFKIYNTLPDVFA